MSIDGGLEDYECDYSVSELNEVLKSNKFDEEILSILNECIKNSNIKESEKREIEILIVGGSLRIPYFQSILLKYLKENLKSKYLNLNKTINMDECISYGNLYNGLIIKNYWKYNIIDKTKYCHLYMSNDEDNKNEETKIIELRKYLMLIKSKYVDIMNDQVNIDKCSEKRNDIENKMYKKYIL